MAELQEAGVQRKEAILDAAIMVFGRFGFRKTSMDDIAAGAGMSKQGLYLHFSSKEEIFTAAIRKYLDDGLVLVQQALNRPGASLLDRLAEAMDMWFGRHLATFAPQSFDIIETGDRLSGKSVEGYKSALQAKLAKAISEAPEFIPANNSCTPREIAQVLFTFGLTWKEGGASRADFMKKVRLCIRACCRVESQKQGREP